MTLKSKQRIIFITIQYIISILIFSILNSNLFSQDLILRFNHLTVKEGLAQNRVHGIVKDKYGFMWFFTWEGLTKYDGYKCINYIGDSNNPNALINSRIIQMYKDSNEDLWFLTSDTSIYKYNYEKDDFIKLSIQKVPIAITDSLKSDKAIFYTFQSKNGYNWVVYQLNNILSRNLPLNKIDHLLTQINYKTGNEYKYRQNQLDPWSLNDEYIFCIYIDNNNIFWVGTYSGGVNKADLLQKQFNLYQHSLIDKNTIIDNSIRAICEDSYGNLWIGTNNKGFTKFNRNKKECTHYQYNPGDTLNSLINNQVRKIYCDRYGFIWIGTKGGLDRFDPKKNLFHHYSHSIEHKIPNNSVFWITEDHSGNLWIGTFDGIAKYDRKNDKFLNFKTDYAPLQNRVRVINEDTKNKLWIATDGGGLICLHRDTTSGFKENLNLITQYINNPKNSNSLIDNRIYSMLEDENGFIWIGTGGGLDRFDPQKETFIHFNKKSGFPSDLILGILNDGNGHLWISHKRGITRLNAKTFEIRNFSQSDGLQDNEFSEDAYFKNEHTGELFFGGINGVNAFFPDSIKVNPYPPKIVFTTLKISNKEVSSNKLFNGRIVLSKPLYLTQNITLTHEDRSFSIEFAALHYSNPTNNQYKYILEGFDKDWINTDASLRIATYSNLEPGSYSFKVIASNNDGIWNTKPATLQIIIKPPWWKTIWFRLIIISIILLIIFISYKVIQKLLHTANQKLLNEQTQLKSLINNIPHHIFIKDIESRFIVISESTIEFMGGKNDKEFINKTDFDFYPEKLAREYFNEEQEIITTGVAVINKEGARNYQGKEKYFSTTKCPIINPEGKTIGLIGIVIDITEQKLIEQELIRQSEDLQTYNEILNETNAILEERQQQIEEQSEELSVQSDNLKEANEKLTILNATKDRFFSIIAHDLRNPFHTLMGFSELLLVKYEKLNSIQIQKYLNIIHESSMTGNNLLENLLQWSRTQTGHITFEPKSILLENIINETFILLSGEAHKKNIKLESLADTNIYITADENMIKTVIRNLVSNSIKFTPANGQITLDVSIQQSKIEITIADTGVGIPEENLNKLFRIDTKITTIGTAKENGSGLGLLLCKEFIEKHNGKIWVESIVGKGSKFTFIIPHI